VRREKVFGFIGLGLFFLFPLISLLQVSDVDGAWRQVVANTQPSVVRITGVEAASSAVSGVVVERTPLRVAIAGRADGAAMRTAAGDGWLDWQAVYADPHGDFTILEAASATAAATLAAAPTAVDPAVIGDMTATPEDDRGVVAVLVAPSAPPELPMWVGKLTAQRGADGRPSYQGEGLRPLRADVVGAAEAEAAVPPVDPALCGAPFVTRDGVVLALYAGNSADGVRAIPMALVRDAVALLDRHSQR
jgi:hypothetical protein